MFNKRHNALFVYLALVFAVLFVPLPGTSAEKAPLEAYEAAENYLKKTINNWKSDPAYCKRYIRHMGLDSIENWDDIYIGDPYRHYRITYLELTAIGDRGESLLQNARFIYYGFPIIIDGIPRGMILVKYENGIWSTIGQRNAGPIYEQVYRMQKEKSDSAKIECSYLMIDTDKLYALIEEEGRYSLIPFNHHSAWFLNMKREKLGKYPSIEYSRAVPILKNYAEKKLEKHRLYDKQMKQEEK